MNYFSLLPCEVTNNRVLMLLHYEEIINASIGNELNIDNNLQFWWNKIDYELQKYPHYTLKMFLEESLELEHYNYILSAIRFCKDDNEDIKHVFFQYGFITSNVEIMKKFAKSSCHGLLEMYQQRTIEDKKWISYITDSWCAMADLGWTGDDGFENSIYYCMGQIIREGYFIMDEYTQVLRSVLINDEIMPVKYLLMCGFPVDNRYRLDLLNELLNTCQSLSHLSTFPLHETYKKLLTRTELYNLSCNENIDKYGNLADKIWHNDNIEEFNIDDFFGDKNFSVPEGGRVPRYMIYRCYVRDNGKILNYIIENVNTQLRMAEFLGCCNLHINQFGKCLNLINQVSFDTFFKSFVRAYYYAVPYQRNIVKKINMLLRHPYFSDDNITQFCTFYKDRKSVISELNCLLFLRDDRIYRRLGINC